MAFRNIDSPHIFIACLRRSSERDFDFRAYVLEQMGNTFRTVWKSDLLSSATPMAFEVQDVDDDGNREIVFEDKSYGTGGGSRSLMIYSISTSRLFSVTESLNWQNRAGPMSPEIELKSADAPEMVRVLEDIAKKHGFLQPGRVVDFGSPEFSVQRWHKENGTRTSGLVSIHHYEGYPPYEATVAATLDTGPILWISFFKGPLIAYERLNDRHFVAFSPSWSYNWAECLAFDGANLWFGSHCESGLMSFAPETKLLETYDSFQGTVLPRVETLEVDERALVINGTLRIPVELIAKRGSPRVQIM
jgi:hypothetical protein